MPYFLSSLGLGKFFAGLWELGVRSAPLLRHLSPEDAATLGLTKFQLKALHALAGEAAVRGYYSSCKEEMGWVM